jgi:hypothetical protein
MLREQPGRTSPLKDANYAVTLYPALEQELSSSLIIFCKELS